MISKLVVISMLVINHVWAACVPAKTFVKYPASAGIGGYQRVHPNGDYVLHSSMGGSGLTQVVLFDLKNVNEQNEAKVIRTPLANEAYPVMTDWSLFSSPYHNDGMRYYSLPQLLTNQDNAKPEFVDRNYNEYYQSVGELSSTKGKKHIRVTLYSNRRTVDYEIAMKKDGTVESQKEIKNGSICDNIVRPPVPANAPAENPARLRARLNEIEAQYNQIQRDLNSAENSRRAELQSQQQVLVQEYSGIQNRLGNGISNQVRFSSPVLSIDGNEIAASVTKDGQYVTQIFKVNPDYSCEQQDILPFQTGKIQFSHPEPNKKGKITFVGSPTMNGQRFAQGIYVYDRDTKELKQLADGQYLQMGYPGFTKDGRVIFPACKFTNSSRVCGAEIIDPNQIEKSEGKVNPKADSCVNTRGRLETKRSYQYNSNEEGGITQ